MKDAFVVDSRLPLDLQGKLAKTLINIRVSTDAQTFLNHGAESKCDAL